VELVADQALYRKYRSADFSEVVGQDHIVRTLTSAIAAGRLSHAYLFTGPRGVGKTSVARLLARALNCTGEPKPCNQCANCLAAINSSLDVIEIDAASNRSIDAVRDLRDKVNLAPTAGAYKVYIIDEVHMLTSEAFNALLKTLEEPPAHAVFILATTEAHKLPETIVSRTQSFSFRPISDTHLVEQLAKIAKAEKIKIEPAAIAIIATAARGGFRDAIGMLDQVASYGEQPITAETVRALLGYSDQETIGRLSRSIASGEPKEALETLAVLIEQGTQPGQVTAQLIEQWRAILLTAVGGATSEDVTVNDLATRLGPARAAAVIEVLLEVGRSQWPQLALEAALVRLTAATSAAASSNADGGGSGPGASVSRPPSSSREERASGRGVGSPSSAPPESLRVTSEMVSPSATESPQATEDDGVASAAGPAKPANDSSELWPKVLVLLKQKNNSLSALLQMYPLEFGDGAFTIKCRFNFHRDLFNRPANRQLIEDAIAKVYGQTINITAITDESVAKVTKPRVDPAVDLVSSALEILGGEVIE
jgi:DNA polymerase-3 subunit gamma/tau